MNLRRQMLRLVCRRLFPILQGALITALGWNQSSAPLTQLSLARLGLQQAGFPLCALE